MQTDDLWEYNTLPFQNVNLYVKQVIIFTDKPTEVNLFGINSGLKHLKPIIQMLHLSVWQQSASSSPQVAIKTKNYKKKQNAEQQKCCLSLQTLVYLFQDNKLSPSCGLHPTALFPLASAEPAASPGGDKCVPPAWAQPAEQAEASWADCAGTGSESCRTETHCSPPTSVLVRQRQPQEQSVQYVGMCVCITQDLLYKYERGFFVHF